ncbi:MAG: DUF5674 family protein [Candidatus Omnitrophota bacterium]
MQIITERVSISALKEMAQDIFGNLVKAVVDVDKEIIALDAELHSDLEALLLENGSKQSSLWGINLYPDIEGEGFIEFDSVINIRPSQSNKNRGVEDAQLRNKIVEVVRKRVSR